MALLAAFQGRGGQIVLDEAIAIEPRHNGHTVHGRSTSYVADTIVVAAGMASGALLKPLGATVPLQAERGYHLLLPLPTGWLNRPLTFHRESCVATPLTGGLRLAGTVEFASPHAAPDWSRADRLVQFAQRYFSKEIPRCGAERWMGSRPSLPDSLPAIGLHPTVPKLAYAFGHQHLGLTQAAVTAQHIADLLATRCSPASLAELDLSRFGFRKFKT
jgi:D-amino-acid dehydrogenase